MPKTTAPKKAKPPLPRIDPAGAAGTYLGTLYGASGSMSLVVADGARAAGWPGWEGSEDGRIRTALVEWEEQEAGLDDGLAFLEFYPDEAFDHRSKQGLQQLALRVAQLPAKKRARLEGVIEIQSGCVAAMLEYRRREPHQGAAAEEGRRREGPGADQS